MIPPAQAEPLTHPTAHRAAVAAAHAAAGSCYPANPCAPDNDPHAPPRPTTTGAHDPSTTPAHQPRRVVTTSWDDHLDAVPCTRVLLLRSASARFRRGCQRQAQL